jgi:predicted CXXCH cytochrome family protein
MATEDIWTVFVSQAALKADGSAPFTSHVEQMHASACFRGTQGELRCTSCHDPHRSPGPAAKAAFYRDRCNSCHADRGCSLPIEKRERAPALNSCIHCHMPTAGSSDIPHATQSDHRVLREPLHAPEAAPAAGQGEVWTIFDDSEQLLPEWELRRARAIALCDQAVEDVDKQLIRQALVALEGIAAQDANDVEVCRSLGFLYGLTRNTENSQRAFAAALQADPEDELSLKNLGLTDYRAGSLPQARRDYEAYLKLNPWDPTMFGPYAAILASSGDLQGALKAAERGLELDPTQRELRSMTAKLYERLGDRAKGQQQLEILREISQQLDPWDQKRRERLQQKTQQNRPRQP